jgi:hypothetical protein
MFRSLLGRQQYLSFDHHVSDFHSEGRLAYESSVFGGRLRRKGADTTVVVGHVRYLYV